MTTSDQWHVPLSDGDRVVFTDGYWGPLFVTLITGIAVLVTLFSLRNEWIKPKRSKLSIALHLGVGYVWGSVFLVGAEYTSQAHFYNSHEEYEAWGMVSSRYVADELGLVDMCVVEDSSESNLCMFLLKANQSGETGPNLLVLHNEQTYLIRKGNWPFSDAIQISKDRLTL